MSSLPLSILLAVYGLFLILFCAIIAINIYHLRHTASLSTLSSAVTGVVIVIAAVIVIATGLILARVNWRAPLFEAQTGEFAPLQLQ